MIILDSHCDSPSQMYRLRDFSLDNDHAHVDFPKMIRGGVNASFFALYIFPHLDADAAAKYAFTLLDTLDGQMKANSDKAKYARNSAEVLENAQNNLVSVLIGLENGSPIGNDLEMVDKFYERGVRYITLTHSRDNQICDSTTGKKVWGGLSPFGHEVVEKMNSCGMLIDLAHSSDDTVRDVLHASSRPVAFTHGCCRALADRPRNLPDDLLRSLADKGGVIGISIYPAFISAPFARFIGESGIDDRTDEIEEIFKSDPSNALYRANWYKALDAMSALDRPSYKLAVDHIDHAVKVAGIDHVGIGTDFDGVSVLPAGIDDVSDLHKIFDEMHLRGYSDDEIEKVAGRNMLRLLDEI